MVCHNCACNNYFQFKGGNKQGNKKETVYHPLENFSSMANTLIAF